MGETTGAGCRVHDGGGAVAGQEDATTRHEDEGHEEEVMPRKRKRKKKKRKKKKAAVECSTTQANGVAPAADLQVSPHQVAAARAARATAVGSTASAAAATAGEQRSSTLLPETQKGAVRDARHGSEASLRVERDEDEAGRRSDETQADVRSQSSDSDELEQEDRARVPRDGFDLPDGDEGWCDTASSSRGRRKLRAARARRTEKSRPWQGSRLWVVTLNANGLCSDGKIAALQVLLGQRRLFGRAFPDVVVITEVDLPAGTAVGLDALLGGDICRRYKAVWTLRSVDSNGDALSASRPGRTGGGVCILIHKRLNMEIREFNVGTTPDVAKWMHGHIKSIRLDPRPIPSGSNACSWWPQMPILLTAAYVPPYHGQDWGTAFMRTTLFDAIHAAQEAMQRVQQMEDVFALVVAHTNAPDGGCPVPMTVDLSPAAVASGLAAWKHRTSRVRFKHTRKGAEVRRAPRSGAMPYLDSAGSVMLQRMQCKAAKVKKSFKPRAPFALAIVARPMTVVGRSRPTALITRVRAPRVGRQVLGGSVQSPLGPTTRYASAHSAVYAAGREFAQRSARAGFISVDGITDHRQPTSYTGCAACTKLRKACTHAKFKRRAVHDVIMVPAALVWQAVSAPTGGASIIRLRTHRGGRGNSAWASAVDHCVSAARLLLRPSRPYAFGAAAPQPAPEPASAGAPKRSKRTRWPDNLKHAFMIKKQVARALDKNMYAVLVATEQDEEMALDEFEERMLQAAVAARQIGQDVAKELADQCPVLHAGRRATVNRARRSYNKALHKSCLALMARGKAEGADHRTAKQDRKRRAQARRRAARRPNPVPLPNPAATSRTTAPAPSSAAEAVRTTRKATREARARLQKAEEGFTAGYLRLAGAKAPKEAWRVHAKLARDAGAPAEGASKLLECLKDGNGKVISQDRSDIVQRIQNHRRMVWEISSDLSATCESNISDALGLVHDANREHLAQNPSVHSESAVAATAADPLALWADKDARRGKPRRDLAAILQRFQDERASGQNPAAYARRDAVKAAHADACAKLQAPYTAEEVALQMSKIDDVGAGTDALEPMLLSGHAALHGMTRADVRAVQQQQEADAEARPGVEETEEDVIEDETLPRPPHACATARTACKYFNKIRAEALLPKRWLTHRCILHYKGKGSDPHCVDNYRGLGIDQAYLKLLSLVMLERLDKFLVATNGLARAQGGFQRQRGTPEQVLTLTETVRAAARHSDVHLAFLDIERAYDSVLHPVLWKRCIDKGIDGHFLAVLQAMYCRAEAQVDVAGVLLPPVPLEGGVLQGNPLSPALFNIYIDGAIRDVEEAGRQHALATGGKPWGLPLPRVAGRGHARVTRPRRLEPGRGSDQDDFMASVFYADDGALAETDHGVLQVMMNVVARSLADIGLCINTRKTKQMVVRGHGTSMANFQAVVDQTVAHPLVVNGTNIGVVDKFDYLGVMLNSRWDWAAAVRDALSQAGAAFAQALVGGFHRAGTLHSMVEHAHAKIFCHFTYVAALMGAGGNKSSAPYLEMQRFIYTVLKTIGGYPHLEGEALAIEAGVWDMKTRIDTLLARFWCKIASFDSDSYAYRAVCLSIEQWRRPTGRAFSARDVWSMPAADPGDPETKWSRAPDAHKQPWGQHLAAMAKRLGLDMESVMRMEVTAVARLQVQPNIGGPWLDVNVHDALAVHAVRDTPPERMRLVAVGDDEGRVPCEGFPASSLVRVGTAYGQWSTTLRSMCRAALRWRGNRVRQVAVRTFIAAQIAGDHKPLRRWALFTSASYERAYFWSTDLKAARRFIRLKLDKGPYEANVRRRAFIVVHGKLEIVLNRLDDPAQRVCYLCGPGPPGGDGAAVGDNGDEGERAAGQPETLEHMLFHCPHADLAAARARATSALAAIARAASVEGQHHTPDFACPSVLLTTFMLCGSVGPLQDMGPMLAGAGPAERAGRVMDLERGRARTTAEWVAALLGPWMAAVRDPRFKGDPDRLPGGRLVQVVLDWALDLFTNRRRALRESEEFRLRKRDPPAMVARRTAPKRTAAQRAEARKRRAAKKRKAKAPVKGPAQIALARQRREASRQARVEVRRRTALAAGAGQAARPAATVVPGRKKIIRQEGAAAAAAAARGGSTSASAMSSGAVRPRHSLAGQTAQGRLVPRRTSKQQSKSANQAKNVSPRPPSPGGNPPSTGNVDNARARSGVGPSTRSSRGLAPRIPSRFQT